MPYLTDNATTKDSLNFEHFRAALRDIAATAQTPLTIGVFGTWGSGKTSLMQMVMDDLAGKTHSVRAVWFTAWKYDRHEALWRAFILRVLEALYPRQEVKDVPWAERPRLPLAQLSAGQKEQVQQLDRLASALYGTVSWEEGGKWAVEWSVAGKEFAKLPAFVLANLTGMSSLAEAIGLDPKLAEAIHRDIQTGYMNQLASMEQFEKAFSQAIRAVLGQEGRLIVFVDDLDRCLPEKAIEVLEAIKLFMEVPGVVFVLGMDKEVVQRGVEARYGTFFRQLPGRDGDLPISGDSYLQKIVQIPFHLPALAVDDLDPFIEGLARNVSAMTRQVLARGVYPNPRQVKRALNIFQLLRTIADNRFGAQGDEIADPLLAKTVLIQTQFPDLYQLWRQYPLVVQMLEAAYERRVVSEEEILTGRGRPAATVDLPQEEGPAAVRKAEDAPGRSQGLLADYLDNRTRYVLLARLLTYPPAGEAGQGRERARFAGLSRAQLHAYVRLAGAVESDTPLPVDVPADLLTELLSGEPVRRQDAVGRLQGEGDEAKTEAVRQRLVQVLQTPDQPTVARLSAGDALAGLGDPRFYGEAGYYLPREALLGFVAIPAGNFRMGSDPQQDPQADAAEQPQHTLPLPAYYLAKYPVTVAQFRAFAQASGHQPADEGSLQGAANHPVTRVTWHDALAYCRWLDGLLRGWAQTPAALRALLHNGHQVTLPSEAEWEKGARGTGRNLYPWGDAFDPDRANHQGSGRGGPSPVGGYPAGASPDGLLDMSGNVWEWTRSLWGDGKKTFGYKYDPQDGREELTRGDNWARILRGGSWYSEPAALRCAYRVRYDPDFWNVDHGFRVCVSPFPATSGR